MEAQLTRLNDTLSGFHGAVQKLEASLEEQAKTLRKLTQINDGSPNEEKKPRITTLHVDEVTENQPRQRDEQVSVYVRLVFLKIGDVDTVNEQFAASLYLEYRWHEPLLDKLNDEDMGGVGVEKYWNPKLFIENIQGEPSRLKVWHSVSKDSQGRAFISEKAVLSARFTENMELQCFPLDTQQLTVHITSERFGNEVILMDDPNGVCSINVETFIDKQEWSLHNHVDAHMQDTEPDPTDSRPRHPRLFVFCHATRKPGYFLFNIVLVMVFICCLAFATFSISESLPQNRLQLSFTLVLTMITFKLTASSSLPKISYLTYLDHYVFTSMAVLSVICVWHAVVSVIETHTSSDIAFLADKIALGILASVYITAHLVFAYKIYKQTRPASRKYLRKDQENKDKLEKYFDSAPNLAPSMDPKAGLLPSNIPFNCKVGPV